MQVNPSNTNIHTVQRNLRNTYNSENIKFNAKNSQSYTNLNVKIVGVAKKIIYCYFKIALQSYADN